MGLERVHREGNEAEFFGPVRLGPQDLRDIAAVFARLDSDANLTLPQFRTEFNTGEHKSDDVEDVLAFEDADTLPTLHVLSGEMLLGFHASRGGTTISTYSRPRDQVTRKAVEEAARRLREITRARELTRLAALRQTGPGKWGLLVLLLFPIAASLAAVALLSLWLSAAAANAAAWGVLWLCYVPLIALGRSRDLIRLRGREALWWERRQGLIALIGVAATVVVPIAIFALGG